MMFTNLFSLTDQIAVVTGSGGIGKEFAQTLAEAGAKVAIVDNRTDTLEEAITALRGQGWHASAFVADVSNKEQVEKAVKAVEKEMGPIDILVNTAGINVRKKAIEYELAEWQKVIDTNLTGTFLCCQEIGRRMISRHHGRIVNISSQAGLVGRSNVAPYCASKAGVSLLTKVLAIEWAPDGVTVNAIGPGFIYTPFIAEFMKDPKFQEEIRTHVPLQRVGETQDLKGILLVLCSKAGAYITGQTIYVDGGYTIW